MKFTQNFYIAAFILLLAIEVFIALHIHDDFIRPYIGDLLVVMAIYCFVRIWVSKGNGYLPFCIFIFSAMVEILQYFNLAAILGLGHSKFFRILIGSVFDWKDILCYGIGCVLLGLFQKWER